MFSRTITWGWPMKDILAKQKQSLSIPRKSQQMQTHDNEEAANSLRPTISIQIHYRQLIHSSHRGRDHVGVAHGLSADLLKPSTPSKIAYCFDSSSIPHGPSASLLKTIASQVFYFNILSVRASARTNATR